MKKKKKETMEFRFYEIQPNEYVLTLLGDRWIRDYGGNEAILHFHNLMEIGRCKNGVGKLILDDKCESYEPKMVSVIPQHYPHVTISDVEAGPSSRSMRFIPIFYENK